MGVFTLSPRAVVYNLESPHRISKKI